MFRGGGRRSRLARRDAGRTEYQGRRSVAGGRTRNPISAVADSIEIIAFRTSPFRPSARSSRDFRRSRPGIGWAFHRAQIHDARFASAYHPSEPDGIQNVLAVDVASMRIDDRGCVGRAAFDGVAARTGCSRIGNAPTTRIATLLDSSAVRNPLSQLWDDDFLGGADPRPIQGRLAEQRRRSDVGNLFIVRRARRCEDGDPCRPTFKSDHQRNDPGPVGRLYDHTVGLGMATESMTKQDT